MRYRRPFLYLPLLFLMVSCSLLEGPQGPVIPTPIPSAPPLVFEPSGEMVLDPVSDIVQGVDPEIETLINNVSVQNLNVWVQTLQNFGTRNTFSPIDRSDFGIGAARIWLHNELVRVGNGRLQVRFDDFPYNFQGRVLQQQNVIATLPGTTNNPNVIVILAHYDSRGADMFDGNSLAPGANDNGSGLAVLLETARLLSSRNWTQTIVFLATAAEEQGTHGSRHYVQNVMLDGGNIDAAINNDIVGGRAGIPSTIRAFAPGLDNSPSYQFVRYMNLVSGLYVPEFPVQIINDLDREGRYGDQREFINAGVGAVRLVEAVEDRDRQHNSLDTADLISYEYLAQVTRLNVAILANAIGAPPRPPQPNIAPMADPGAFLLTWPVDPSTAGYVISFRPLGSPDYDLFRYVGRSQAGNVAFTGLNSDVPYAVSLAALNESGRIGLFTPELVVEPNP